MTTMNKETEKKEIDEETETEKKEIDQEKTEKKEN